MHPEGQPNLPPAAGQSSASLQSAPLAPPPAQPHSPPSSLLAELEHFPIAEEDKQVIMATSKVPGPRGLHMLEMVLTTIDGLEQPARNFVLELARTAQFPDVSTFATM